jgi:hypothetical protein
MSKHRTVKLSHQSATAAAFMDVCHWAVNLAPENDMLAALEIARLHVERGKAPRYVERDPGTPGRRRFDDSEAVSAILAKRKEYPDWLLSRVLESERKRCDASPSDVKRWRNRIDEIDKNSFPKPPVLGKPSEE